MIERVFKEPGEDFTELYETIRAELYSTIQKNKALPTEQLLDHRYHRFRRIGWDGR